MQYLRITIAGDLGSGKSTIAQIVSNEKNLNTYSTGVIQRKIAEKRGMSTFELNEYMKTHPEIDTEIDNFTKDLSNSDESFILDSRMAWFFIPNSFKIYLKVQSKIAGERVYKDQGRVSEKYKSVDDAEEFILGRKAIENSRFNELYGVNCDNLDNYDFVIDTSYASPKEIAKIILNQMNNWSKGQPVLKYWISPLTLKPTQDVISLGREDAQKVYNSINKFGLEFFESVSVIKSNNSLYIYDGHKRTSAAILAKLSLIPINFIAQDQEQIIKGLTANEYANNESQPQFINSWESTHKFAFNKYIPGLTS